MLQPADDVTLESIDFEWVKNTTKISKLKKALFLLEQDGGYFVDLIRAVEDRMAELDPKYQKKEFNKYVAPEDKKRAQQEVSSWTDEVGKPKELSEIFEEEGKKLSQQTKKKLADNEKNKGNEALRSNDLQEALNYYSKSIQYDPTLSASFCNRALVYLKLKKYNECISDCDKALELQPNYTKAYHRKGKAYFALKQYLKAYQEFKQLLTLEPDNSEVNGEFRECQKNLKPEELQMAENAIGFKKVQIIEEDEEEESSEGLKAFQKEIDIVMDLKNKATEQIKKGMYLVAVDILTDALRKNQKIQEQLTNKDDLHEIIVIRCQLLGNISLCYKQLGDYSKVINYASMVVDEQTHLKESSDMLIKVLLRRAMAFESIDKLSKSKIDYMRVKTIDPGNLQASTGLNRLAQLMSKEENNLAQTEWEKISNQQRDFQYFTSSRAQPTVEKTEEKTPQSREQPHQEEIPNSQVSPQQQQTPKEIAKNEEIPKQQQTLKEKVVEQTKPTPSITEHKIKLTQYKEDGNKLFKEKKYKEASARFVEGSQYWDQFQGVLNQDNEAKQTYLALLTNNCLCLSNLGKHKEIINIANLAIQVDQNNLKALYRRGLAYAAWAEESEKEKNTLSNFQLVNELYERARRDLEKIIVLDQENKQALTKLEEIQRKNASIRIKLNELKEKEQPEVKKDNLIQPNAKEEVKQQQQTKPNITKQKLDKIAATVIQGVVEQLLKNPSPETASIFEKNVLVFKNENPNLFIQYLSQLNPENFKKIYQKKNIPPEIILQLMKAISQLEEPQTDQINQIFEILPLTNKFDLTMKCFSKKEKAQFLEIIESLKLDQVQFQKIRQLYNL